MFFESAFFIPKERRESLLSFASLLLACVTRSLPPRIGKLCAHGVAYPSLIPHTDISVSACVVPMPESGNRGKRARLSSRDSENRFLRVSEQVISLRALFLSLSLSLPLPSAFIRTERKGTGTEEGTEETEKEEKKEEEEKVRRHSSRKPPKSFSDRCYLTI